MLELIYKYTGMVVFWGLFLWIVLFLAHILLTAFLFVLDLLNKRFKMFTIIIEFAFYRLKFKDWIKDKERLNTKNNQLYKSDYNGSSGSSGWQGWSGSSGGLNNSSGSSGFNNKK